MSFNSCTSGGSTMSTSASPRSHPVQIQTSSSGSPRSASSMTSTCTNTQFFASTASRRRESINTPTYNSAAQYRKQSAERPNAYISDADLWGIDNVRSDDCSNLPYLKAPPAPPRSAEQWLAQPLPQAVSGSWMAKRRASGAARKASAEMKK